MHLPFCGQRFERHARFIVDKRLVIGGLASLHESYFPQRPIAAVRANVGSIAQGLIESCGGSAYLPATLVEADNTVRKLWRVPDAPEILLKSYAVFPLHGEHRSLIDQLLKRFLPGSCEP